MTVVLEVYFSSILNPKQTTISIIVYPTPLFMRCIIFTGNDTELPIDMSKITTTNVDAYGLIIMKEDNFFYRWKTNLYQYIHPLRTNFAVYSILKNRDIDKKDFLVKYSISKTISGSFGFFIITL